MTEPDDAFPANTTGITPCTSPGPAPGAPPRPDAHVAARIEELLREQLAERGIAPATLTPQDIMEGMTCGLAPDNSMTYAWRGAPLLHVTPELKHGRDKDVVLWRMFTRDDMPNLDPQPENGPKDSSEGPAQGIIHEHS